MRKLACFLILLAFFRPACGQQHEVELAGMVDSLLLNSRFTEALSLLEKESPLGGSALLQNKKAEALTRNGDLAEAEALLRSVLTRADVQRDAWLLATTRSNLGFLQLNQGRNDLAEESMQRAIRQFEEAGKAESPEAAQAYAYLGLVYMSQGKYAQAQEQIHRSLSLRQARTNSNELIAATYNDLGLVYSQTDKEKALDYFEQAQKMYVNIYGSRHPKIAIANINTGIVYRDLELFGDAVNNFEKALEIWNTVYTKPHPAKAIALYNLGQTYVKLGDRKSAMAFYQQAREMYEECYGTRHPEIASVWNAIGNLQLADSDYKGALDTYQKALQANVPSFKSSDHDENPTLKDYYHGTRLLHTLLFKAQAFEAMYFGKSLHFSDLRKGLNILLKCDSLIDQLRQHSTNENDKMQLGAMASDVYADGVRIAYEAGLNAFHKETYFKKAFYFAEKSKGAVLLESISESNAKAFAGIPAALLEEEKELKTALALTGQKLAQKPSPEEEKELRATAFALKRSYDAFTRRLEDQYPAYFNLKFNAAAPSIEQLQGLLGSETAVLSYFLDEKNSQLYTFVIRQDDFKVLQRPWSRDIEKYVAGLRNGLYFNESKTFQQSAVALGDALIPRLPSAIRELVIIPTGKLSVIPFETLLTRNAENVTDYSVMPFLMKRFSIRYEFSAGLILQKSTRSKVFSPPSIFLCAPVSFSENRFLADLPGTEQEVEAISQLFREKDLTCASYTRLQADEKQVKSVDLEKYHYLHFATHGIVDESNPELSRIFLQPDGESEDGNLFAGEIYNLRLNAELVTLSACQTGLGKIQKGEGVIGLSRALVYAGSKHVIVSFWNVADASTAILMKDFYEAILQRSGSNHSVALQEAKLKMLETESYSAPFYWAPFVLIGF